MPGMKEVVGQRGDGCGYKRTTGVPLVRGPVLYLHCNVANILIVYCAIVLQDVIQVNWIEGTHDLFVFFLHLQVNLQ